MLRLIFLPGLLCTPDVFSGVLRGTDAAADTIALPDSDSFDQITSDIIAALPERAVLVGLSMGSYICIEVARRAPDRVAGLVLIGCAAAADSEKSAAMRGKVVKWARREGIDALAASISDSMLSPASQDNEALRQSVTEMARAQGLDVFERHQTALAGRPDNVAALSAISCPALVMTGADDTVTPPQLGRDIAARLPSGRFIEIVGAGHLAALEQPAIVAAHLNEFIDQQIGTEIAAQ